jgi:hypothetical protein
MIVGSQSRETGPRHTRQPLPYGSLLLSDHRKQFHLDGSTAHITGFDDDGTALLHTHKDRPTVSFSDVTFQADPRCNNKQAADYMSLTTSAVRENEFHARETERHEITPASEHKIALPESRQYITSNPRESFNLVPVAAAVTLPPKLQPTTNGKPAISLSRDRRAQAQFCATSAATQQDFMGTERRANAEHYTANTENETNNLQATDATDTLTTHIGEQLTDGPSDLTDEPHVTHDIREGETGQHRKYVKQKETPIIRSLKSWNLGSNASRCDYKIVKVIARKAAKPQALYKAKFKDESAPRWVPVMQIPPEILADFHVRRFQRKKNRKI